MGLSWRGGRIRVSPLEGRVVCRRWAVKGNARKGGIYGVLPQAQPCSREGPSAPTTRKRPLDRMARPWSTLAIESTAKPNRAAHQVRQTRRGDLPAQSCEAGLDLCSRSLAASVALAVPSASQDTRMALLNRGSQLGLNHSSDRSATLKMDTTWDSLTAPISPLLRSSALVS